VEQTKIISHAITERGVLAIVVRVEEFAYRKEGARTIVERY